MHLDPTPIKKVLFVCLFVCLLGSGKCQLIFNIKNKKNKIILVGASLAPKKEPNADIEEMISPISSARNTASYSSSLLLITAPNFLYILSKNSLISFTPLLSFLASSLALLYFLE